MRRDRRLSRRRSRRIFRKGARTLRRNYRHAASRGGVRF